MNFYYLFFCVGTLTRIIKDDAFNKSVQNDKAHKFFLDGSSQSKNFIVCHLVISPNDLLQWLCNTAKINLIIKKFLRSNERVISNMMWWLVGSR
ncbi:hypothetical protein B9J99_11055 [Staphylococcus capitis]|nr:hypothetical protein B9J99_11055 [Staphylococcus capitis]